MTLYRATNKKKYTLWVEFATTAILDGFKAFGTDVSNWHIELFGGGKMEV